MSYVRNTGLEEARRRRHRRSVAIVAVVAVLVVAGFVYALTYMNRSSSGSSPASCVPSTTAKPAQASFQLNIYNASRDNGRAKTVGAAMKSQGFSVGVVSNDPYGLSVSGVGQIRFGAKGKADAEEFVAKVMPGAQLMQDGRTDDSVDLVLGDQAPTIPSVAPTSVSVSVPPGC